MEPIVLNTPEEIKKFLDECAIKNKKGKSIEIMTNKFQELYPNMNKIHLETKSTGRQWGGLFGIKSITISRND